MAVIAGLWDSYSATQPLKRVVTDRILLTDPNEIVALNALGLNNESKFNFVNTPGKNYEWLQDVYYDRTDLVNSQALTSDSASTSVIVDTGANFRVGDVILIDSELMWVSAISTNTLTVTRNFGGTQATHLDNAVVTVLYRAILEGAASALDKMTEPTTSINYSQILTGAVQVSRTNQLLQRYGMASAVDYQIDKKMDELVQMLNRTTYRADASKVGTASAPRQMGTLKAWITTNSSSASSAALTQKMIEDEIQDCWNGNGRPDLILCGAWAKRKIADFYSGSVRTERSETMGGITIERVMSPLGIELSIAVDRDCQTDHLYLVDRALCGFITIDPFFEESLGKVGDTAYFGQIVGEYGFVLQNEAAHSYIHTFSTTA